jgi:glycosyltransferase involved in cell wall biosynthesis
MKVKEKLRVLRIAHSSLTPALRDRERALVRCYPEIDLEVVTTKRWREAEVEVEATEDDLFPVRPSSTYLSKHIQLFAYDPRSIIAALRKHRPHLIDMNHEPFSVACAEVLTLCNWFAPQTPVAMQTAQNILRRYPVPFRWLEQRAFRRVDAAYVCSETVSEVLRAKGFEKPVAVIPFGVNLESFVQRPTVDRHKKSLTIGFVGRMLPGKGLDVLADALHRIRDERWQLLVVGDGPVREEFEAQLKSSGVDQRAKFTGAVSYHEMPEYFRQIDVLVVPTQTTDRIREQFGRVIVEAMASGIPVIGSTCGAIPEVIADSGLVVAEGSGYALANALKRMIHDPSLREGLMRAGRRRVQENYTWEHVAHKTRDLYRQILCAHPKAALSASVELAA